ncbi:hypothetical protein DL93DRAFT_514337 [Clavulina sp. PMI_390]|nr:hypothetical protein DL93DRAFT_514337 [Clavulina sp. PMI_390]
MFIITYLAGIVQFLSTSPVHPVLYPFPWGSTLHAARITHAFRGRMKALGTHAQLGFGPEFAGFLLMCWGGGILSNFLMFQPPPQLLTVQPWLNYISVHILFGYAVDYAPSPKFLDTYLPIFDAILRTGSVCGAVSAARAHPNPAIASSTFFHLIIGAVASAGGGVTASTLGVWNTEWSLRRPPFLQGGVVDTLDLWGGSIVAAVYSCLLGLNPAYEPYTRWLSGLGDKYEPGTPLMTPLEARSVSVIILAGLFAWRAYMIHYTTPVQAKSAPTPTSIKEKTE